MKRMLIVTTISGFLPQFEYNDVNILKSYGVEIYYASDFNNPVYSCDVNRLREDGIRLHNISIKKSPLRVISNMKAFFQLKKIIDNNKIDFIHCHNPLGGVVARLAGAASKRKPKVIYTAHGLHFYSGAPIKNWLFYYLPEKLLARLSDIIITINAEDYKRVKKFKLRKRGRVYQIHGVGVDDNSFRIDILDYNQCKAKRAEIGIPENAFHIVTAAELNDNKNQAVVIEALALLRNPNIHYSLCGCGKNEERLRKLVASYNLENQVHLLGYRTDMNQVLNTADVFAFPSKREGFGVAAVEALLSGVPLVVSDNRGSREYAVDGINSIVLDKCDASHVKSAVDRILKDADFYEKMRNNCRESAKKFTVNEVGTVMRKIYKTII